LVSYPNGTPWNPLLNFENGILLYKTQPIENYLIPAGGSTYGILGVNVVPVSSDPNIKWISVDPAVTDSIVVTEALVQK
jgi:hypothetical protein